MKNEHKNYKVTHNIHFKQFYILNYLSVWKICNLIMGCVFYLYLYSCIYTITMSYVMNIGTQSYVQRRHLGS